MLKLVKLDLNSLGFLITAFELFSVVKKPSRTQLNLHLMNVVSELSRSVTGKMSWLSLEARHVYLKTKYAPEQHVRLRIKFYVGFRRL